MSITFDGPGPHGLPAISTAEVAAQGDDVVICLWARIEGQLQIIEAHIDLPTARTLGAGLVPILKR